MLEQRFEGLPAESEPVATVRAGVRAHDGRQPRHTELRWLAPGHVLQTLASSGHTETVHELLRRVRRARVAELLRGQAAADQHPGVRDRAGLRGQRLDRLGGDAGRLRQRRRKGTAARPSSGSDRSRKFFVVEFCF